MPKLVSDLLISIITGWLVTILLSEFLLAICLGAWVRNRMLKIKNMAPVATPLGIGFGILILASLLVVYDQYYSLAVRTVQEEENKKKAGDEKKKMEERTSPEYLENTIRHWLDEAKYPTQSLKPKDNERFRIMASGPEIYFIYQDKDIDGFATMHTAFWISAPYAEKLRKFSSARRAHFMDTMEVSLLNIGVQHSFILNEKEGNFQITLRDDFPMDATTTRADFLKQLWLLKRGRALMEVQTKRFFLDAGGHGG